MCSAGFHEDKLQVAFLFLITCLLWAFPRTSSMAEAWPWALWSLLTHRLCLSFCCSALMPFTPVVWLWNCCLSSGITKAIVTEPLISLSLGICWCHQDFCRGVFMLPEWYRSTAQFVFPTPTLSDQYWPVWAAPAVDDSSLFPVAHSVDEMVCFTKNFPKALTEVSYFLCQCCPWPPVCPWIQEFLTCWFCSRSDLWLLHLIQLWGW